MPRAPIVVVGSSNTDLVIRSAQLPRPGQTVLGGEFQIVPGGKGANQAVAAARAGALVTFVANIGRDDFGEAALGRFRDEGIDTRHIVRGKSSPSGVALILVDRRGENLISVASSSNDELSAAHIRAAEPSIRIACCLVVQLETPMPAVLAAIKLARQHNVPVLLNPAPARPLARTLLRQVDLLTPNETELAELTRRQVRTRPAVQHSARMLVASGVKNVLVTCGARGVCWCSNVGEKWFVAPKIKAVDTVGAGDCFSGALAAALAGGESLEAAIPFAISAASISVTRPGAQPSMPRRQEILNALGKALV